MRAIANRHSRNLADSNAQIRSRIEEQVNRDLAASEQIIDAEPAQKD
jgi:hypothetical protein